MDPDGGIAVGQPLRDGRGWSDRLVRLLAGSPDHPLQARVVEVAHFAWQAIRWKLRGVARVNGAPAIRLDVPVSEAEVDLPAAVAIAQGASR